MKNIIFQSCARNAGSFTLDHSVLKEATHASNSVLHQQGTENGPPKIQNKERESGFENVASEGQSFPVPPQEPSLPGWKESRRLVVPAEWADAALDIHKPQLKMPGGTGFWGRHLSLALPLWFQSSLQLLWATFPAHFPQIISHNFYHSGKEREQVKKDALLKLGVVGEEAYAGGHFILSPQFSGRPFFCWYLL